MLYFQIFQFVLYKELTTVEGLKCLHHVSGCWGPVIMFNKVCVCEGVCVCWEVIIAHWAVVVFRTDVTVLLAPVDLIETTAADLTHFLMRGLMHTCPTYASNQTNTVYSVMYYYPLQLACVQLLKEEQTKRRKGQILTRMNASSDHFTQVAFSQ